MPQEGIFCFGTCKLFPRCFRGVDLLWGRLLAMQLFKQGRMQGVAYRLSGCTALQSMLLTVLLLLFTGGCSRGTQTSQGLVARNGATAGASRAWNIQMDRPCLARPTSPPANQEQSQHL